MRRLLLSFVLAVIAIVSTEAQGVMPLPSLHVDGKWLVDTHGNHVVLHGVMDTPNSYFNSGYWHGTNGDYNDTGVGPCIAFFEKQFAAFEKAKCNIFRLHLDPAWTNDNSVTASGFTIIKDNAGKDSGKAIDPSGNEVGAEANIVHFNSKRLTKYMKSLFIPLMKQAMYHGQYVVIRPPGVCPQNLKVGDYYQDYLKTVWDIVSKDEFIQQYAGQISLELANEPVNLKNASNNNSVKALHDYFQPIVDLIRANGFTGIIWVPGTGYQSDYKSYSTYPITGDNIAYAVHVYSGWYGGITDDNCNPSTMIANFKNQVPVVDKKPILVSEVDWSPLREPLELDHYNEWNQPVYKNLGTWATGSTSKWGKAYKAVLDKYVNISMTLTHPHDFIDLAQLVYKNKVVAAFDANPEACGQACMEWYADYYKVNWPHADDETADYSDYNTVTSLKAETTSLEMMANDERGIPLTATYADGHSKDVSFLVEYTIADPTVASITDGCVKALANGETTLTAAYTNPSGEKVTTTIEIKVLSIDDMPKLTSVSQINNKTFMIIGTDNKMFYCKNMQNLGYDPVMDVIGNKSIVGFQYKAQAISGRSGCYLLKQIKLDGSDYMMWTGSAGYINSQDENGWCSFVLGLNNQYGQDIKDGAVWQISYVGDKGFTLKNMATGKYLKNTDTAKYSSPAYFKFVLFGGTTGISDASCLKDKGQMINDNVVYDLQGRRIGVVDNSSLKPGLYIVNGKKIMIK